MQRSLHTAGAQWAQFGRSVVTGITEISSQVRDMLWAPASLVHSPRVCRQGEKGYGHIQDEGGTHSGGSARESCSG